MGKISTQGDQIIELQFTITQISGAGKKFKG